MTFIAPSLFARSFFNWRGLLQLPSQRSVQWAQFFSATLSSVDHPMHVRHPSTGVVFHAVTSVSASCIDSFFSDFCSPSPAEGRLFLFLPCSFPPLFNNPRFAQPHSAAAVSLRTFFRFLQRSLSKNPPLGVGSSVSFTFPPLIRCDRVSPYRVRTGVYSSH